MNKICTSIEQSQKLIELGIDIDTGDMYYDVNSYGIQSKPEVAGGKVWSKDIPAWSLSALLELFPERIPGTKFVIKWDGSYYIEGRDCLYDNPLDAAFKMVCWLLENKKIV